jgi:cytochrome c5
MKKLITLSFIVVIGIMACTKKAVPASSGASSPGKTETVMTSTDTKTTADDKMQADAVAQKNDDTRPPASTSPIPSMDMGKTLYMSKCGTCHALKSAGDYTGAQWDNILKTMAPRAKLSGDETKQLQGYIKANAKI